MNRRQAIAPLIPLESAAKPDKGLTVDKIRAIQTTSFTSGGLYNYYGRVIMLPDQPKRTTFKQSSLATK